MSGTWVYPVSYIGFGTDGSAIMSGARQKKVGRRTGIMKVERYARYEARIAAYPGRPVWSGATH